MNLRDFVKEFGKPYSEALGIDIKSGKSEEICKWFLASILYSKPIRESTATNTYKLFEKNNILTASKIVDEGWDSLVAVLDEGKYTRYDFSTATKLLEVFGNLNEKYDGDLNRLYESSKDSRELEGRIRELGKGVGDTTISIFLRDLRPIWPNADPKPSLLVKAAMRRLKIKDLKSFAKTKRLDIIRLETALLRLEKDFIKRGKKVKMGPD